MSELVILSEVNNLEYLRVHGVYPSQFFTDLSMFEIMSSYFSNTKVCVLLSGNCAFSNRKLNDILSFLNARMQDGESGSIQAVYILSDIPIKGREYYRYEKSLGVFSLVKGKRVLEENVKFWSTLDYTPKRDTEVYLSDIHSGDDSASIARFNSKVKKLGADLEDSVKRVKLT